MGDVVTALGRAVQEEGHEVEVVVPKYDVINYGLVGAGGRVRVVVCVFGCECWGGGRGDVINYGLVG
jgi:hypothetical protein